MSKTLFIDIDGTLIKHDKSVSDQHRLKEYPDTALPGTLEKLIEWEKKGYKIILTTGRRECWREFTEKQLYGMGIWYDKLIMGLGCGPRVLINDLKPGNEQLMATAINLVRNVGVADLDI